MSADRVPSGTPPTPELLDQAVLDAATVWHVHTVRADTAAPSPKWAAGVLADAVEARLAADRTRRGQRPVEPRRRSEFGRSPNPVRPPEPDVDAGDRCRCGKLKAEASPGCTWHQARAERAADELTALWDGPDYFGPASPDSPVVAPVAASEVSSGLRESNGLRKARHDYPELALFAAGSSGHDTFLVAKRRESAAALDEIDRLRVGGVAERAVLDAAAAETDAEDACRALVGVPRRAGKAVTFERALNARDARRAAVRAWRGAAPTAEETP